MEFNKCIRCGAFYVTNSCVCPNCQTKDNLEQSNLKDFLEINNNPYTMEDLATKTGISTKNLNRFLSNEDFINL